MGQAGTWSGEGECVGLEIVSKGNGGACGARNRCLKRQTAGYRKEWHMKRDLLVVLQSYTSYHVSCSLCLFCKTAV